MKTSTLKILKITAVALLLVVACLVQAACSGLAPEGGAPSFKPSARDDAASISGSKSEGGPEMWSGEVMDGEGMGGEAYLGDVDVGGGEEPPENDFQSGTLTAGEWSDLLNWDFWSKHLLKNEIYALAEGWKIIARDRICVTVLNGGEPVRNVKVELADEQGQTVWASVTDHKGRAYLFYNLDGKTAQTKEGLSVLVNGQKQEWDGSDSITVQTGLASPQLELDLLLMVDTTGSMSDELTYIQKELESVLKRINSEIGVSLKISVNFYRDDGDEYVVRSYDFTTVEAAMSQLAKEYADGGGDYPEAVHKALEDAVSNHSWRQGSVKIMFFVLDAPAHQDQKGVCESLMSSVSAASAAGIRIIPVAASGVDSSTEIMLRTFAILTGGTYTFLTDDSGYGYSHLEPSVGDYEVEKLNDLMVRLVLEYCGKAPAKPAPQEQTQDQSQDQ
ncbi:MAG: VWA domain-containing protein [Clostridia bacterium]|nr:VWA domain-containing protein [Clostridia bacterium]